MKKSQQHQQRRRESSVLSGGSKPNSTRVVGQSSMNLRSLEEDLPANNDTPRRNSLPAKLPVGPKTPEVIKNLSPRISVSGHATVSSVRKQTMKKDLGTPKAKSTLSTSKKPAADGIKKTGALGDNDKLQLAANLPMDSLCLCLEKLQCVYHVVACAAVCKHWREAACSDVVWKSLYLRWWQNKEKEPPSSEHLILPLGHDTWRDAFISKYSSGKHKILSEAVSQGVNGGWLHVRRVRDRHGKQVKDCSPGNTMRKLVDQLGLTFHVCINRDPPVRLKGKAAVTYFPASCLLRYPMKSTKGVLSLSSLKSFKVSATSDRLLRTIEVASFVGPNWEMISRKGYNPGPLRLLQQDLSSSNTLLVGTLFEGVDATEGFCVDENGQEQVLLLVASLHLSDIVWRIMELGDGLRPQILRRIHHDPMDPSYGLHGWHVSIQLHTFGKLLWSKQFHEVFWSPRESTAGQKAVFLLISSHEAFPGLLNTPWQTEVFSGEIQGVFMLDFTLWDEGSEIAWHCTNAVRTEPAELATVEYGPPGMDGERVHTGVHDEKQGVSVSMNLCIPFADGWSPTVDNKPMVVITDLRFALTSKFMVSWFGQSTV